MIKEGSPKKIDPMNIDIWKDPGILRMWEQAKEKEPFITRDEFLNRVNLNVKAIHPFAQKLNEAIERINELGDEIEKIGKSIKRISKYLRDDEILQIIYRKQQEGQKNDDNT